ncbi:unnamed protein product [Clavelina lepadiformis]|uniref:Uncharacterized protein n=1 Tax=Clavelina lepadiformis TaxID=159417 RepID=A0ABP0FCG2_CLALP
MYQISPISYTGDNRKTSQVNMNYMPFSHCVGMTSTTSISSIPNFTYTSSVVQVLQEQISKLDVHFEALTQRCIGLEHKVSRNHANQGGCRKCKQCRTQPSVTKSPHFSVQP